MNIKSIVAIALLSLGLSLAATGQVVSQAYEVALSDFRAPATLNGGVAFKQCESCERQLVRVTAATRYAINGKAVRLKDFRKAVSQASDRDEKTVIVLHHLESDTVSSLDVSL
jgi:hypothetical protein